MFASIVPISGLKWIRLITRPMSWTPMSLWPLLLPFRTLPRVVSASTILLSSNASWSMRYLQAYSHPACENSLIYYIHKYTFVYNKWAHGSYIWSRYCSWHVQKCVHSIYLQCLGTSWNSEILQKNLWPFSFTRKWLFPISLGLFRYRCSSWPYCAWISFRKSCLSPTDFKNDQWWLVS